MAGLLGDIEEQENKPYRVLARKYRPLTLGELIGQEAMVRTLTNAFQAGRLPQAWILTGVRGIGKTTTARIIAKALNCTGRKDDKDFEPCNECEACKAITEDRHVDVQEMDAASRTGVDDIREIIDGVRYGPVSAKYKVYILDEVHMLSKNAFNALLKTLEEPPPHTKFIFATTEIRKVPITVLSRCQRFDLRRIDSAALSKHYSNIAKKEGASFDEEAINLISHAADGSVRDGLSLLDQAIARAEGQITSSDVKDMLGLADRGATLNLCTQILRGQSKEALTSFDSMQELGHDPVQLLQDLADLIHQLTRAQILSEAPADWAEADRNFVSELSDIKLPALTRAWQILLKGIQETLTAAHPAKAAEMVIIRLSYAAQLPPPGDLIKKLREEAAKEKQAKETGNAPSNGPTAHYSGSRKSNVIPAFSERPQQQVKPAPAQQTEAVALSPNPTDFRALANLFAEKHEGRLYAELCNYVHPVTFTVGRIELRLENKASKNLVSAATQCLNKWTGHRWILTLVDEEGAPTLREEDDEKERQRMIKVENHPLMKSLSSTFPEAKIIKLTRKETLMDEEETLPAPSEDDDTQDE